LGIADNTQTLKGVLARPLQALSISYKVRFISYDYCYNDICCELKI